MKILVTGGAGFIGSHLVDKLISQGHSVYVVDNLEKETHGIEKPKYLNKKANYIWEDIGSLKKYKDELKSIDVVYHLAAYGGFTHKIQRYFKKNTLATSKFLEFLNALDKKPKKIVVASSMAVYGEGRYKKIDKQEVYPESRKLNDLKLAQWDIYENQEKLIHLPSKETDKVFPLTNYALSKYDQEKMVLNFCKANNVSGIGARFFLTYGPRQSLKNPYTGIFSIFSTQIKNKVPPIVYEDGYQLRDFIYVDDLVNGLILLLNGEIDDNRVFNIGTGQSHKILDIAKALSEKIDNSVSVSIPQQFRHGDVRNTCADIDAIKRYGFKVKYSLDDGVDSYLDWFLNEKETTDYFSETYKRMIDKNLVLNSF
jgi:dTDP-L-rhamnose 4-epimerase